VKYQWEDVCNSIRQYMESILCEEGTEAVEQASLARQGQLPVEEVVQLLSSLLEADRKKQTLLEQEGQETDEAMEQTVALLTRAEAYERTKDSLIRTEAEAEQTESLLQRKQAELEACQAQIPRQEQLSQEILTIDLSLPDYDRLRELEIALTESERQAAMAENDVLAAQERKKQLKAEIETLKEERKSLENIGAEKEKLLRQKQEHHQKRQQLQKLVADIAGYKAQKEKWEIARDLYLAASEKSARLLQEFDEKNRAFLDEQAGILAGNLEEGTPCPVCGSLHHPKPAQMAESAPTEEDVKKARKAYEKAAKDTEETVSTYGNCVDTWLRWSH
jgi:exonuclease SbcC